MIGSGRGQTVLIVDDESGITGMLADRLSFAGFITLVAEDAARALELVRSRNPDIILTDLYLPKLDGEAFVRQLRAEGIDTPVIMMSAGMDGEMAAMRAHAAGFLEKPFNMNRAIEEIERALGIETTQP